MSRCIGRGWGVAFVRAHARGCKRLRRRGRLGVSYVYNVLRGLSSRRRRSKKYRTRTKVNSTIISYNTVLRIISNIIVSGSTSGTSRRRIYRTRSSAPYNNTAHSPDRADLLFRLQNERHSISLLS